MSDQQAPQRYAIERHGHFVIAFHDHVSVRYMKISLILRALVGYWADFTSGIIRQRGHSDFPQYLDDFRIAIIGVVNPQLTPSLLMSSTPPLFIRMSR